MGCVCGCTQCCCGSSQATALLMFIIRQFCSLLRIFLLHGPLPSFFIHRNLCLPFLRKSPLPCFPKGQQQPSFLTGSHYNQVCYALYESITQCSLIPVTQTELNQFVYVYFTHPHKNCCFLPLPVSTKVLVRWLHNYKNIRPCCNMAFLE